MLNQNLTQFDFVGDVDNNGILESEYFIKSDLYHKTDGLCTIFTHPHIEAPRQNNFTIERRVKVIILLHGHLSHKNASFQPLLAKLLSEIGYGVIRFDFRNNGDSEDNFDVTKGRIMKQDLEDLDTIVSLIIDDSNFGFFASCDAELFACVGHSRGALTMFDYFSNSNWFPKRFPGKYIPHLVDLNGRYNIIDVLKKYDSLYPGWEQNDGFMANCLIRGSYTKYWVNYSEIMSTAKDADVMGFIQIDKRTQILLIYCLEDKVVVKENGERYRQLFDYKTELVLIPYADHNFYNDCMDLAKFQLPKKRNKWNFAPLLAKLIAKHFTKSETLKERSPNTAVIVLNDTSIVQILQEGQQICSSSKSSPKFDIFG